MCSDNPSDGAASSVPMFSFLTTAFRTENSVARTIRAVQEQTFFDWEMVVVDNGNSDRMYEAVSPFLSDRRIRLVRQENRGAAGGQMAAAEHARGRYFVVLNSDDSIRPEFAKSMAEFLGENPQVAAVACDAVLFVDPGQRQLRPSYLKQAGLQGVPDPCHPLRVSEVIDGPCPYYTAPIRRDVWESLGGMSGLGGEASLVDDLDFWLRALTAGYDVRMIPEALGCFRIEPGSVSRPIHAAASEELEDQLERSLRRAAERSGEVEDQEALKRALRRLRYWQAVRRARGSVQAGSVVEALEQYRIALRQRRTARAVLSCVALRLAPRTLLRLYRLKQRLAALRVHVAGHRRIQTWRMRFGHDA